MRQTRTFEETGKIRASDRKSGCSGNARISASVEEMDSIKLQAVRDGLLGKSRLEKSRRSRCMRIDRLQVPEGSMRLMSQHSKKVIRATVFGFASLVVGDISRSIAQEPPATGSNLTEPVARVSKNLPSNTPAISNTAALSSSNAISAPHPLDPALELARQSLGLMQTHVNDYTAVLVKRERIGDELGDNEFMFVKIRNRKMEGDKIKVPFSVYLAFLKPASVKGREVIYIENANEGKLVAHEGGMKRMLGTHLLEPDGYLAMAGQKYPLTDIGLENLLVKLIEKGERDKQYGHCHVKLEGGAKVGGRECSILEVVHPVQKPHYEFHKAQIFMDNEWKIPVRYAAFDWPEGSEGELEVIEEYTYQNVKINVGLTDKDFDVANGDYNFHKR